MKMWPNAGLPVEVEPPTAALPAGDPEAPVAPPDMPPAPSPARARFPATFLVVSLVAHAALAAVLAGTLSRPGMEVTGDSVSVELVLAPAALAAAESAPAGMALHPVEEETEKAETVEALLPAATPARAEKAPKAEAGQRAAMAEAEPARPAEAPAAASAPTPEILVSAAPSPAPPASLQRLQGVEERAAAAPERAQRKAAPEKRPEKTRPRPAPAGGGDGAAGRGAVAARGSASAGERAAYAARLLSHVQRFRRYPAEAQRLGLTGTARLSITIDRNGRLAGSRIVASSGNAVLDAEAAAIPRRAAPYPRPPEGVGGATITFAVTIRFAR